MQGIELLSYQSKMVNFLLNTLHDIHYWTLHSYTHPAPYRPNSRAIRWPSAVDAALGGGGKTDRQGNFTTGIFPNFFLMGSYFYRTLHKFAFVAQFDEPGIVLRHPIQVLRQNICL